MNATLIICRTL